jgi:peroxiredoxin
LGALAPEIRAAGADIAAIAVTATFSQMAFAKTLPLDFPLLSDWDGEVCGAYGVRYEIWKGHRGLAKRSLFVVDEDRVVRYVWSEENALELPDFGPVVEAVSSLQKGDSRSSSS